MKPAAFEYLAPASVEEALTLLQHHGPDAKVLAGGQSLVPAMNFRLAQPAILIALDRIETLAGIRPTDDGGVRIGAMTRQRVVERSPVIASRAPLLTEAMPFVAHVPIRNRGTIGGSLAHADPAGELPAVMVALDARFRLQSLEQERWIPAGDFFLGLFTTALEPGELLVEIEIPPAGPGSGSAFLEVARRHGDYGLAGFAGHVALDAAGRCRLVRAVLLGVSEGPLMVAAAGTLVGEPPSSERIATVAERLEQQLDPPGDIHASPDYRRHLALVLVKRGLALAFDRAGSDPA
jgi:CO/xanthine dehydrogenase FAD-binding subunit